MASATNATPDDQEAVACPRCGLCAPPRHGPAHSVWLSSPGCWATFEQVLAVEFADPEYFPLHQMTVDSYGASHPGKPERRAIQSTALHLMTLQLFIEDGIDAREGPNLHKRIVQRLPELTWLDPPKLDGLMTVADVLGATTAAEHLRRIRSWAGQVWDAWAPHHATIRDWNNHSMR